MRSEWFYDCERGTSDILQYNSVAYNGRRTVRLACERIVKLLLMSLLNFAILLRKSYALETSSNHALLDFKVTLNGYFIL